MSDTIRLERVPGHTYYHPPTLEDREAFREMLAASRAAEQPEGRCDECRELDYLAWVETPEFDLHVCPTCEYKLTGRERP
jgi:hypothetical protein